MAFALSDFARECRVADPERFVASCSKLFDLLSEVNAHAHVIKSVFGVEPIDVGVLGE